MRHLTVVPSPEKAREWMLDRLAHETAVFGTPVIAIGELECEVLAAARRSRRTLPPGARSLALRTILFHHEPGVLSPATSRPGLRRALESFLVELGGSGSTPDELERVIDRLPPWLRARGGSLARIALAYQRALALRGLEDPEFAPPSMDELPAVLENVDAVVIQDVIDWAPSRLAWVSALASALRRRGGHLTVELPHSDAPLLAEAIDPVFRSLEAMTGDIELRIRPLKAAPPERLSAFNAGNATAEAREVSRRVLDLLRVGSPPDRITIAAKRMSDLAPELLRALRRLGVPASYRPGVSVAETAVYRLAHEISVLNEPADFTRERVAAILGSSFVDVRRLAPDAPLPSVMIRHLRMAAIRSGTPDPDGRDGFTGRLMRLAAAQKRTGHLKDADLVHDTAETIQRLFKRLDEWPQLATWIQHGRALARLLNELGVGDRVQDVSSGRLSSSPPTLTDSSQARALAREQAALKQLRSILADLDAGAAALKLTGQQVSRAEFVAWLRQRCEEARLVEASAGAVQLSELEDLAGRRIDHLFIAGAYEGRLPESPEPDLVLSDEERWQLNLAIGRTVFRVAESTSPNTALPSRHRAQMLSLALAVEAASQTLTVSWPRVDRRGRPLMLSPLIDLLGLDLAIESIPLITLDRRLAIRSSESIEVRREAARERVEVFRGALAPGLFSGDVSALEDTLPIIAPGRPERPWSASALERAATCTFRYLAEWMWRAREEDEPVDQIGPMETGRLAHLAAEHAVREIVNRGQWSTSRIPEALETGVEAASKALDSQEPSTVLGHPDLWSLARERMLARLRRLIEEEIRRTNDANMVPMAYELGFGLPQAELPAVRIGGVFFAGQVDRVDLGPGSITILDYKSGKTESNARKYEDGALFETQFQLPLYVEALGQVLPQAKGRSVDAGYISLRDAQRTIPLSEALARNAVANMPEALAAAVRHVVARVTSGDFAIAPKSCTGCHLRPVCRIPRPEDRS